VKAFIKTMLAVGALIAPSMAAAQDYPSERVTLVIPFPPGGSNDTVGRYLADGLSKLWEETVVVENRPGAGSAIGSAHVTQAEPDGYTLLFVSGSFTTNAATQEALPFDPLNDLQPIGLAAVGHYFLLTGSRVPLPTLEDLAREAKAQTIFYGTSGVGSIAHLSGQLLNDVLGIDMEGVHYSGGSEAMVDLGGGRIDVFVGTASEVASGIGTPVAVMSESRSTAVPDVPTVREAGFPDALVNGWWGVFAPAGTPEDVAAKINEDITTVMSSPEATEFLARQGAIPPEMSAEEFTSHVASELEKWRALAEEHGIRAN
jgi:tripartite-type tricarboxylate transporter receptor subunit TctC